MLFLGAGNIKNLEPKIVVIDKPIQAVGLGTKTSIKRVFSDIPRLGKQYKKLKDQNGIPNRKEPWGFIALSKDYDEQTQEWEYIMGDVVTNIDNIPPNLVSFEIPAGSYAVFPIRPRNMFLWGPTIAKIKRYAYDSWLPNSKYEQAGFDFEYHDERSMGKNPEISLYFAIQEKK
ncbi:MAG TPA: GyrI-like domain-containing protein [Bacillota bacterium]|nr:GyrI-like domain-containing protein [Bacillota bacterium]